jgi:ribonuclease-3
MESATNKTASPATAATTDSELPYNPRNRLIQPADVEAILSAYGVKLKIGNIDIYRKACVHRSYCTRKNENVVNGNGNCPADCIPLQEEPNERLEFLGDSILNFVCARYLFERYPGENEGFLTKMRTKLVNGVMLASLCKAVGLYPFILISQQIEANEGRFSKNILEDTFECFLAAVYLDFNERKIKSKTMAYDSMSGLGMQVVECWIRGVFETCLDWSELVRSNQNFKDMLIKFCQHTYQMTPRFAEVGGGSKKHAFTVSVHNDKNVVLGVGTGETKKAAEHAASFKALVYYGQLQEADFTHD